MANARLRSNAQVRSAGIDGSVGFLVIGLVLSALVLLTLLGTTANTRRSRGDFERMGTSARSDVGH